MIEQSFNIIHGLLATVLALFPLAMAAYYDLEHERKKIRKTD